MNIDDTAMNTTKAYSSAKSKAAWIQHTKLGILRVRGKDALDLLNRLSTNELRNVAATNGAQTVLTSDKGRIVDVLTVVPQEDASFLWMTSASALMEDVRHIRKYIIMDDVRLTDESDNWAVVEILGPAALAFLREMDESLSASLALAGSTTLRLDGIECQCLRMPSVSELSYYLFLPTAQAQQILDFLRLLGENVPELNAEEYEILRIENGMGKYGSEWNEQHNPLEAGLLHLVNFKKGCYIGQEVIARLDSYNKVQQRLVGFRSQDALIPGAVTKEESREIGQITSSVNSPSLGNIALGYIRSEFAIPGKECVFEHQGSSQKATLVQLPFAE